MKYLNLDINHYLSDKDKGEKPIVILIKGAVIYLILLIVSILVISYAHHIGWPKELKPKENITKDTILMLIVIGPIIEETIHRLWLSFHKTEIIISVTCISFFILGELYHIDDKYIRILTKSAIAFVMGYLFYKIPQAGYDSIKSNKYLYRSFIWFSILWFSLMHINNYYVEMCYLPYLIIACLPQFSAGILFTYFRLNLGIYASIFAHILLNGVTYILL